MKTKKWTIVIDNEFKSDRGPFSFDITEKQMTLFLSIFVIFFITSTAIMIFAQLNNLNPDALIEIYAKRNYLINSIDSSNKKLNIYLNEINKITEYEKRLRTLSNLSQISEDMRQLGLGGYDFHDDRITKLDMSTKILIENLDKRLY